MSVSAPIKELNEDLPDPQLQLNSYDTIPYCVGAFPQTHPDRLATIATLFGLSPASPDDCRVLELGCAAGGNLIPMALGSPSSRFVGVDLSARQIAEGRATARELGLSNIELLHQDILNLGDDLGVFDYILVHGVYSWVPPEVQQKILEICRRNLNPHGVAYISYNTYPGWHARGAIREMLWYHTQHFPEPEQRIAQARALLGFLVVSASNDPGYGAMLRQELALLMNVPDPYLLHEHLEEFNEPLYFHQFIQRAAAAGLQYLGEAQLSMMLPLEFDADTEQSLRKISHDLVHMEQYMDFLRNRMFRQTLLCHVERSLDFRLQPHAVRRFHIASSARNVSPNPDIHSGQPEEFRGPNRSTLTTRDPLMKAAMAHLARHWPRPIPFTDLHHAANDAAAEAADTNSHAQPDELTLATRLLNCYTTGMIEFSLAPPKFTLDITEIPIASPYARLCAQPHRGTSHGFKITNMLLQSTLLGEPSALILRHLDGHHTRDDLADILTHWLNNQSIPRPRQAIDQYLDQLLTTFARAALLIG